MSNGRVCGICRKFELADSETEKSVGDKTVSSNCKTKTI